MAFIGNYVTGALSTLKETLRLVLEQQGLRPKRSFGIDRLDVKLANYLTFKNGVFVEAGANDGLTQSNTAYFELYLGWTGLLIEPVPRLATLCASNRRRSQVEQCALVPFNFPQPVVPMTYCNLMSYVDGARGSPEADESHLLMGETFLAPGDKPYKLNVPAHTLTSLLITNGIGKIDLLSLDVEGFEVPVLMGLDFSRYTPAWILVEANDPKGIEELLRPQYTFVAALSDLDRLYRLK